MTDHYTLLKNIIFSTFFGNTLSYNNIPYSFQPMLLEKKYLLRKIKNPANNLERLIQALPAGFQRAGKSQLYRSSGGWIEKGLDKHHFRVVNDENSEFIIPYVGTKTVGIDTSSYDGWTIIIIGIFRDPDVTYEYFSSHLNLTKNIHPIEYKFYRLHSTEKTYIVDNLKFLLQLSCESVLIIKTNAIINNTERISEVFKKLIDGCFSGYERLCGNTRNILRNKFFEMVNNVPIHCDSDFDPFSPDKVVRSLVKTLSNGGDFNPLFVPKKSEESKPIQIADVFCGALQKHIINHTLATIGIQPLEFNNRLKGRNEGKIAKAYLWVDD